jgi:phytoene dehydrogenase-like protein
MAARALTSTRTSTSTCARRFVRRRTTGSFNGVFDAVVIGGGHNGLIAAAYLGKAGLKVAVFEKRYLIGGAAVTEELVPGFKFSRASYLLSLLRPQIISDLELKRNGLKLYFRDPESFTPLARSSKSLTLWNSKQKTLKEIAQFSEKDASVYFQYMSFMKKIAKSIELLLDGAPFDPVRLRESVRYVRLPDLRSSLGSMVSLMKTGSSVVSDIPTFWEVLTGPASKLLNRWFESEPLKATLASDSVIGAMVSPYSPGSSYVLLHHVMGELDGKLNSWAYVEGGMGAVSEAIANYARSVGVQIHTELPVKSVLVNDGKAEGVVLDNGKEIKSKVVLSNATPKVTFLDLLTKDSLPEDFRKEIESIDYSSGVTKINVALSGLPNFTAVPNESANPAPHHRATIHLGCESLQSIHDAYLDGANRKIPSQRPFIEMTIPSSLDPTLAPPGCHVVSLFTQYTPYELSTGEWTQENKNSYCDRVFDVIEEYTPGFRKLVIERDILVPKDLEDIFGLTGGNIFHGAMSLDQLYLCRPTPSPWSYRTPLRGLYLCGSGTHPGGGVMGSSGRICAGAVLDDL